jgi:hypothetical protein
MSIHIQLFLVLELETTRLNIPEPDIKPKYVPDTDVEERNTEIINVSDSKAGVANWQPTEQAEA